MISGLMPLGGDAWMAWPALEALQVISDEVLIAVDARDQGFSGVLFGDRRESPWRGFLAGMVAEAYRDHPKVRVVHAPLYVPGQNSKTTERSVRNALSWLAAGIDEPDRWLVSLDADEVMQDPEAFRAWLLTTPRLRGRIFVRAIDVWKVIGDTALVMDHPAWMICVGTQLRGQFVRGRATVEIPEVVAPVGRIIHWTMHRRTKADVRLKLSTYGHSDNLGREIIVRFVDLWESTTLDNFHQVKAAIPYSPNGLWGLRPVPVSDIGGLPAWAVTP